MTDDVKATWTPCSDRWATRWTALLPSRSAAGPRVVFRLYQVSLFLFPLKTIVNLHVFINKTFRGVRELPLPWVNRCAPPFSSAFQPLWPEGEHLPYTLFPRTLTFPLSLKFFDLYLTNSQARHSASLHLYPSYPLDSSFLIRGALPKYQSDATAGILPDNVLARSLQAGQADPRCLV